MTEMFENTVNGDQSASEKSPPKKTREIFFGKVVDKSIKKDDVTKNWNEAGVKTSIVPKKGSTKMHGEDSGDNLGDKKKKERNIERSATEIEFLVENRTQEPESAN